MARLLDRYRSEIISKLMKEFGYTTPMEVPRLEKIVINVGVGEATKEIKILDSAVAELTALSGQKPVITRAKKAIANFKLRAGLPIGCMVTLRRRRMYEFFDRLVHVVIPRVRDFNGFPLSSFDGAGNYTIGIRDQTIFPEIAIDKVQRTYGMNITVCTTARTPGEGQALLRYLGMPFALKEEEKPEKAAK